MENGGFEAEHPVVDARGHRCPTPTLRLRRALKHAADGDILVLLADDPMVCIDVPHFIGQTGHVLLASSQGAGGWRFTVRKGASAAGGDHAAPPA